jgi:hypothetical protein
MLFLWGTTIAKAMAYPRIRRGRTRAIKTFMVLILSVCGDLAE